MQIDLNITSTCNLGCTYCSEGHNPQMPDKSIIENSKTNVSKDDIVAFVNKVRDEKPNEPISIAFWGGEPFINFAYSVEIMTHYKDDLNTSFFFYTNGTYIEKNIDKIKNINSLLGKGLNGSPRLRIQVSYDGGKVNDTHRLTKSGKSSSDEVKKAFTLLKNSGIDCSIKSVITPETFKHLYDAYLDITSLGSNYFPTPDTHSDYPEEDHEIYMNDLKINLMKVAKHIYDNNLPMEIFGWFRNSRALCQAGTDKYIGIDLDGTVQSCHGSFYSEQEYHAAGTIFDNDIIDNIDSRNTQFTELLGYMENDCVGCESLFCMKCPVGSMETESTKKTVANKLSNVENPSPDLLFNTSWVTKNINVCRVFKLNDTVFKPLIVAINKRNNPNNKSCCSTKKTSSSCSTTKKNNIELNDGVNRY